MSHQDTLKEMFTELFPSVNSGDWVQTPVSEQQELRETIALGVAVFNTILRVKFDQTVWKGHESGSVSTEVKSIRVKSDSDKPRGRPAPSPDELLARAMKW